MVLSFTPTAGRESLFAAKGMKPGEKLEFHNLDSKLGFSHAAAWQRGGTVGQGNHLVIGTGYLYQLDTRERLVSEDVESQFLFAG